MKVLDFVAANYAHARNADAINKAAHDAGKEICGSKDEVIERICSLEPGLSRPPSKTAGVSQEA
ncbi:hypothetical protein DSN66_22760 [Salmonella enterica subsp. enterica serovar Typhimurium]|nr:hypothetical protein DSN66_22760 [Salmonella enterica subsp. enterica serovar Typhimurium]